MGRSMSGKFWIFIALKPYRPNSVSMMKNRMLGIGFLIDHAETFMMRSRLLGSGFRFRRVVDGCGIGRFRRDDTDDVAIAEEAAAGCDHLGAGIEAVENFYAFAAAACSADLGQKRLSRLADA